MQHFKKMLNHILKQNYPNRCIFLQLNSFICERARGFARVLRSEVAARYRHAFVLACLLAPRYDGTQNRFDVFPSTEKLGWYRDTFRDARKAVL